MELKFSKNLIDKTIKYFKQKYDLDISSEVANEYLSSFSGFFLAFVRPVPMDGGQTLGRGGSMGASNTHRTL